MMTHWNPWEPLSASVEPSQVSSSSRLPWATVLAYIKAGLSGFCTSKNNRGSRKEVTRASLQQRY